MRLRLSNAGVKATWALGCRPNTGAEGGIAGADHAVAVTFRIGFAWPSDAKRTEASEVLRAGARHDAGTCLAATVRTASRAGGAGLLGAPGYAAAHRANAAAGAHTDLGSAVFATVEVAAAPIHRRDEPGARTTPL